jgi:hypothetical protein
VYSFLYTIYVIKIFRFANCSASFARNSAETSFFLLSKCFQIYSILTGIYICLLNLSNPMKYLMKIRILCWIPKATHILSEYVILTTFTCNNSFMNAPQCYVIRKLPVLYSLVFLCEWFNAYTWNLLAPAEIFHLKKIRCFLSWWKTTGCVSQTTNIIPIYILNITIVLQ